MHDGTVVHEDDIAALPRNLNLILSADAIDFVEYLLSYGRAILPTNDEVQFDIFGATHRLFAKSNDQQTIDERGLVCCILSQRRSIEVCDRRTIFCPDDLKPLAFAKFLHLGAAFRLEGDLPVAVIHSPFITNLPLS